GEGVRAAVVEKEASAKPELPLCELHTQSPLSRNGFRIQFALFALGSYSSFSWSIVGSCQPERPTRVSFLQYSSALFQLMLAKLSFRVHIRPVALSTTMLSSKSFCFASAAKPSAIPFCLFASAALLSAAPFCFVALSARSLALVASLSASIDLY